jgi:PAS domain S-box-containing protein
VSNPSGKTVPLRPVPLNPPTPPSATRDSSRFADTRLIRIHLAEATGQKIQDILDSISDAFVALSRDWTVEYANPSYMRLFAPEFRSVKEIIGCRITELSPELCESETGRRCRAAMETQMPDFFEIFHPGTQAWLGVRVHPSPEMLCIYASDVTESRRADETTRRLAAIVESSDDAIISKNLDGLIMSWNRGAEDIYGYTADEVLGKSVTILIPDDRDNEETQILDRIRRGERIEHYETVRQRKDGRRIHVSLTVSPIRNNDGVVIGASKIARDITEQKANEEALKAAKETAEAASAAKDRFLAVLSHELRTPLTPVLMAAAVRERDESLPESVREDMAMIRRNVELETKLIDDLLDLSRIVSGKLGLRLELLELDEAVRQVCAICQPEIREKGVRLHLALEAEGGRVMADSARLHQVIWNVVKNAGKFTPEGGEIHVRTRRLAPGRLCIEVRDTGIGLEAEMLPKIFDAFEQGDMRVTRHFGGLGLGLAISKALVSRLDGSIWAESEGLGRGATFHIELVEAMQADPAPAAPDAPVLTAGAEPLRILLVEDHADTAFMLSRLLESAGYAVETARSADEALRRLEAETFDLFVSDIGLPDATGHELMRRARKCCKVQGIAISGYGMDEDVRKSLDAGFSEHLTKPVNLAALEQAIRRVRG